MRKPATIALCPLFLAMGWLVWAEETTKLAPLPDGFVDLQESVPGLVVELRYYGERNFIGKRIAGYEANRCVGTAALGKALAKVQADLRKAQLGVKVFDAYRPQQAVTQFVRWAKDPSTTKQKATYYPNVRKGRLIAEGYIASKSSHSRGSAIDLTLVDLSDPNRPELDMGSAFDLFDPRSHSERTEGLTAEQRANRLLLRTVMERHGFRFYSEEWWHFFLKGEPYPKTYFRFPIR